MDTNRNNALHKYLANCRELLHDTIVAKELGICPGEQNNNIYYAVDFSEIYAYVYPDRLARKVTIFPDDSKEQMLAANEYVLNKLFFDDISHPLILLPPSHLELKALLPDVTSDTMIELSQIIGAAETQLRTIRDSEDFKRVQTIVDGFNQKKQDLSEEDLIVLVQFLETHAQSWSLFLKPDFRRPAYRLRLLLKHAKFSSLAELPELKTATIKPDSETVERWRKRLGEYRKSYPTSSNDLDALAIGYLKNANKFFQTSGLKLVLVTRSTAMQNIFDREDERQYWDPDLGHVLVHPRSFMTLFRQSTAEPETVRNLSFQEWLKTLETFIRSAEEEIERCKAGDHHRPQHDFKTMYACNWGSLLQNIKSHWRALENLLFSDGTLHHFGTSKQRVLSRNLSEFERLLSMVRDDQALQQAISDRVLVLSEEVKDIHINIGFILPTSHPEEQSIIRDKIALDVNQHAFTRVSIIKSSRYSMPFTLEFYTGAFESKLGQSDWHSMLRKFIEMKSGGSQYERRLAMAFLLGTLRRWTQAKDYSDLAIDSPQERQNPPRHEGYYFRAVCRRLSLQPSESLNKTYGDCLKDLDKATALKKASSPKLQDPRYLCERATVMFRWAEACRKTGLDCPPGINYPQAVRYSEEALNCVGENRALEALICNNLCYFYLHQQEMHLARRFFKRLDRAFRRAFTSEDPPANIADTRILAKWILSEKRMSEEDRSRLISQLEDILKHEDLLKEDKQEVLSHIKLISEGQRYIPLQYVHVDR